MVCYIESFSEDLKNEIKAQLVSICHGESKIDSPSSIYSYKETLKEFCKRYERKSLNTKKGMIGELLSHIIIQNKINKFKPASPYFNMEEGGVKKGFDLVLFDKDSQSIWITEVKAGESGRNDSNKKNLYLINKAKKDLTIRLNKQEVSIWYNAINGASLALKKGKVKDQINTILVSIAENTISGNSSSRDKNVILTSVLFNTFHKKISLNKLDKKRREIINEKMFGNIIVFSIQKETYRRVADFLKDEASR